LTELELSFGPSSITHNRIDRNENETIAHGKSETVEKIVHWYHFAPVGGLAITDSERDGGGAHVGAPSEHPEHYGSG